MKQDHLTIQCYEGASMTNDNFNIVSLFKNVWQWYSTGGDFSLAGHIWKHVERVLIVMDCRFHRNLMGKGWEYCSKPDHAQNSP